MKIRIEPRHPVRSERPASGRARPEVHERVRGVLVIDGKRVTLPPKPIPFETDGDLGRFVRDSADKIRRYVADDALIEKLAAQLWMLARPYMLDPEEVRQKREREREAAKKARRAMGLPTPDPDQR